MDVFIEMMSSESLTLDETDLKQIFNYFDKHSNGFITEHDLKGFSDKLGLHLNEDDTNRLIKEADLTGAGKIYYKGLLLFVF